MRGRLSFAEAIEQASASSGLYRIFLISGLGLKVGIGSNLKRRLKAHAASRASGLKLQRTVVGRDFVPGDFESKSSILAKHLFFDRSLASGLDLRTEAGRRTFLAERCYVIIQQTSTTEEAKRLEQKYEQSGAFRYVGLVQER